MNFLKKLNRKQLLKLLGIIMLSDGYINYTKKNKKGGSLRLYTLKEGSGELHTLFGSICMLLFNRDIKTKINERFGKDIMISNLFMIEAIRELLNISPEFKTTPGPKMTDEAYLSSPQPTINFLFNEPKSFKILALRMWFDFDGCIVPSFKLKRKKDIKKNKIYRYYQVQFECEIRIAETNPNLINELINLCSQIGIKAIKKRDKRKWSGFDGISISKFDDVRKFIKYGPITNIKISSKSKRFFGISKRSVCLAVNDLFNDKNVSLSKSFKYKEKALKYQILLNQILNKKVQQYKDL